MAKELFDVSSEMGQLKIGFFDEHRNPVGSCIFDNSIGDIDFKVRVLNQNSSKQLIKEAKECELISTFTAYKNESACLMGYDCCELTEVYEQKRWFAKGRWFVYLNKQIHRSLPLMIIVWNDKELNA